MRIELCNELYQQGFIDMCRTPCLCQAAGQRVSIALSPPVALITHVQQNAAHNIRFIWLEESLLMKDLNHTVFVFFMTFILQDFDHMHYRNVRSVSFFNYGQFWSYEPYKINS